ncbi:MAG: GTPase ObgE [Candidatus Gastranaerophilales bacterium]|nr:GTPase ObgE [Candidatus Gastranaerophilales bacterium]
MFIDKSKIKITSGSGGNGAVAWRKEKYIPKGGPAGGDGGKGGDVYILADDNLSTLLDFKYKSKFAAGNGENGGTKNMHGKNGNDIYIKVPCGTIIRDSASNKIIGDLVTPNQKVLIASGGRGGRGNARFATSIKRAPQFCEPGEPGIERDIDLELKLIADVGLIGLPNAGKSTLISVLSAAKPKIADYPFTTLTPNLGVVKKPDGDGFVVADIPGLIEGASHGAGLGLEFLKHIERTKLLVHLLDMTEEDPIKNYNIINQELETYGGKLKDIFQTVTLNKIDAADEEKINSTKEYFIKENKDVFAISAATGQGVHDLINYLIAKTKEIPAPTFDIEIEEDKIAYDHDDSGFIIYKDKKSYSIVGGKIDRLVSVTDLRNTEAVFRLQNILKSMGVFTALEESGIKDGDLVIIGNYEFEYYSEELKEVHDER